MHLHLHMLTFLYNFTSNSIIINLYIFLPHYFPQVFLLKSFKKSQWTLRPAQEELQRMTGRIYQETTLSLSSPFCSTTCTILCQFTRSNHPTLLSALSSCNADSNYTPYKGFSCNLDSHEFAMLGFLKLTAIHKMHHFKYKIYNIFLWLQNTVVDFYFK